VTSDADGDATHGAASDATEERADGASERSVVGGAREAGPRTDVRDRELLLRLWGFLRPYRGLFFLSLLLLPIISALNLVQPHLIQLAVDDHITPGKLDGLGVLVALFAGAVVGGFALQYLQFYIMQWVGQKALRDLRQRVFDHLLSLRIAWFKRTPTGRIMTRVTTDIESLQDAFSSGMVTILGDLIALVAIVVILLVKDWQLALVTFAVVPVLLGITVFFRWLMRRAFRAVRVAIARSNSFLQEAISGMRIVQLFVQERRMRSDFESRSRELRDASFRAIKWDATFYALVEAISSIAVGLLIWYGAGDALEGVVTLGLLISFIEYVEKFFRPIRDLTQKYTLLQSAMASSERIFELLDTEVHVEDADDPVPIERVEHEIEFRDVWFTYDDVLDVPPLSAASHEKDADEEVHGDGAERERRADGAVDPDEESADQADVSDAHPRDEPAADAKAHADDSEIDWILEDISFTLPVGSKLALVGHTGAGKSTITRLLTRMYDVQRGAITIDGTDIRSYQLRDLRRLFKVVHQDVHLFSGTVLDNITLRAPGVTREHAIEAAKTVQAHPFIERLDGGYDHEIGEGGGSLSAGERQLISFARALAHRPDVLVLDEATSSVDPHTEHALQRATAALLEQQTSVVVAHRLSTIRHCDRILVLHHGELREQGTHEDLMEAGGLYETLYRLQYADTEERAA